MKLIAEKVLMCSAQLCAISGEAWRGEDHSHPRNGSRAGR